MHQIEVHEEHVPLIRGQARARRHAQVEDRGRGVSRRLVDHEIAVVADLSTCEARDPKGHYKKARLGEIPDFTGVSAPYEQPETPDLLIDTDSNTIARCVDLLVEYVHENFILKDG